MEAVSFNDTLGEIRRVADEGLSEDRVIPDNTMEMYEVIGDFREMIGSGKTTQVDTKYKTMDRKVRPVAAPLPEGSEERMKQVAVYRSLRNTARKFTRRWFGPYVVMSADDNATYHIAEHDGMRIAVPVMRKRIKSFQKRYEDEPNLDCVRGGDDPGRTDEGGEVGGSEDDK